MFHHGQLIELITRHLDEIQLSGDMAIKPINVGKWCFVFTSMVKRVAFFYPFLPFYHCILILGPAFLVILANGLIKYRPFLKTWHIF